MAKVFGVESPTGQKKFVSEADFDKFLVNCYIFNIGLAMQVKPRAEAATASNPVVLRDTIKGKKYPIKVWLNKA